MFPLRNPNLIGNKQTNPIIECVLSNSQLFGSNVYILMDAVHSSMSTKRRLHWRALVEEVNAPSNRSTTNYSILSSSSRVEQMMAEEYPNQIEISSPSFVVLLKINATLETNVFI